MVAVEGEVGKVVERVLVAVLVVALGAEAVVVAVDVEVVVAVEVVVVVVAVEVVVVEEGVSKVACYVTRCSFCCSIFMPSAFCKSISQLRSNNINHFP